MQVQGLEDVVGRLKALPLELAKRAFLRAGRRAARLLQEDMQARAPIRTGFLRRSIRFSVKFKPQDNKATLRIRVGPSSKAFYARFIERGYLATGRRRRGEKRHALVRAGKTGARHIAARPFARPTFDLRREDAVRVFASVLREELEKAVQSLLRRRFGALFRRAK